MQCGHPAQGSDPSLRGRHSSVIPQDVLLCITMSHSDNMCPLGEKESGSTLPGHVALCCVVQAGLELKV